MSVGQVFAARTLGKDVPKLAAISFGITVVERRAVQYRGVNKGSRPNQAKKLCHILRLKYCTMVSLLHGKCFPPTSGLAGHNGGSTLCMAATTNVTEPK